MVCAVIDTNVLVSALLVPDSRPAKVLSLALHQKIIPCFDDRILQEYEDVLFRPKFPFSKEGVEDVFDQIRADGLPVVPPLLDLPFADVTDRKFYEAAISCDAVLITGNIKHFPKEPWIVTPAEFLDAYHL